MLQAYNKIDDNSDGWLLLVALLAVKDVNSNPHILPDYQLDLSVVDGQCKADVVMKKFIDIIKTRDASRFQSTVGMLGNRKNLYFWEIPLFARTGLLRHSGPNSWCLQALPYRSDQLRCGRLHIQGEHEGLPVLL